MGAKARVLVLVMVFGLALAGCSGNDQSSKDQGAKDGSSGQTKVERSNQSRSTTVAGLKPTSGASGDTNAELNNLDRPTVAPDLESVGNFRPGPPNDEGEARTLVDFKFDQKTFLTGGNRTSFHLVPKNDGKVIDGSDAIPQKDREGDAVISVVFPGEIKPENFARGYVDKEVLSSGKQGNAPMNIGQVADVGEGNATKGPDLVSVTRDADQFLFKFDQPLTEDDVVQNTGGLRLYFPNTKQTGATAVDRTGDPKEIRATFKQIPEGLGLGDVVGGYATQGTVQGQGKEKAGLPNAFDEVSSVGDTGARVCPAPETAGKSGKGDGLTKAPDLMSVGNFRRGPVTDQGEPRTCVDFTFDQKAYLKGGNHTSFHLAKADGSDALDATYVIPDSDEEGDVVVSAAFPGKLEPENFPRGYVDRGVVTSRENGANAGNPFNIEQAAIISKKGGTKNPDLVSVTRDGDQVLYKFDEALTEDDVVQNTGGLRLYFPETDDSNIKQAGALAVKRKNATTLRAYFGRDLPGGKTLDDAVGGLVKQGAVQAAKGSRGGNNGKSAFDEVAPLEDTGAEVCPAPDTTGMSGEGDGPTVAPDLASVGNFRRGPFTTQFTPTTCVDFTFDQRAYLSGSNRTSLHLAPKDGGDALDAADIKPGSDKDGDAIITATFPGKLEPKDFARGYVDKKSFSSDKKGNAPTNIGQAADIGDNNSTKTPDLVSVTKDADQFLFTFDQPLTKDDVVQDTGGLRLYFPNTKQTGATAVDKTGDPKEVRATFKQIPEGMSLSDAVGAFVTQGAVQGTSAGADNAFDEVVPLEDTGAEVCSVKNTGKSGGSNGPTRAPDLMSVGNFRQGPVTDQGEPRTCVDFTFDQKTFLTGGNRSSFHLAPAKGGDALDATNIVPDKDVAGDTIITAVFPGDLKPEDFARGYVDKNIASSSSKGNELTNVAQAEGVSGSEGNTATPDLVSVTRDGGRLLFKFDQPLTTDDLVQDSAGLQLYYETAKKFASERVETTDDPSVLAARYTKEVKLDDAAGALVTQGTVQSRPSDGEPGGPNAFDEVTIED